MELVFEADFAETSHGFSLERSAHDAVREIYKYLNWGCEAVYDVDLEKYFDTVEHHKLMKLVAWHIVDKQILHVIKLWLGCGYVEDGEHKQSKRGTPPAGVIGPWPAKICPNPVDQAFKRNGLGAICGAVGIETQPREDTEAENGTTSERGLSWISILSDQEQGNREEVDIGITKSCKSATMSGEGAKTHTPLDTIACERARSERQSVFAWLGWTGRAPKASKVSPAM